MTTRFCRDCASFEERRDIDGVPLCGHNIGPYVCCEEFELKEGSAYVNRLYNMFCAECVNFEDMNGVPLCAKNHSPRTSCELFASRFEKLGAIRQNNHIKAVLLIHAANSDSNPEPIPGSLVEMARELKVKW